MTTATALFPSELPAPLIEGYSFAPFQAFQRQQVSDGPPRYRTRSPRFTSLFEVEWHFTEFEFRTFRLWFEDFAELNFNRWFLIDLAVGLATGETTPRTLDQLECHFFDDWNATIETQSNDWRVRATLEARYKAVGAADDNLVTALSIDDLRPTDIVTALSIDEERPTDIITSGTPSFWT